MTKSNRPTALIVEDEEDVRALVRVLLAHAGFDPIWDAADGEAAIANVYHHQPDVVVLDYMLPVMRGDAVAAALHLLSPESYIILFSAVLHEKPDWADTYLDKMQVEEIGEVALEGLSDAARRQRINRTLRAV